MTEWSHIVPQTRIEHTHKTYGKTFEFPLGLVLNCVGKKKNYFGNFLSFNICGKYNVMKRTIVSDICARRKYVHRIINTVNVIFERFSYRKCDRWEHPLCVFTRLLSTKKLGWTSWRLLFNSLSQANKKNVGQIELKINFIFSFVKININGQKKNNLT